MRLEAEFTTAPFLGEGDEPPPQVTSALAAARSAGLTVDVGPLGTLVRGNASDVLAASVGATTVPLGERRPGDVVLTWEGADALAVRLPQASTGPGESASAPSEVPGLVELIDRLALELGGPLDQLARPLRQRAVRLLEERGAFTYRKSAEVIAEALGVSRFTVYNYLNRERGG